MNHHSMQKFLGVIVIALFLSAGRLFAGKPAIPQQQDVIVQRGKDKISGTLTLPGGTGKFPLVILVPDIGPHKRDNEWKGFPSFRILADYLASKGIATYRFDSRGTGMTGGKQIWQYTIRDQIRDLRGMIKRLQRTPGVNAKQIGLAGHGFGSLIVTRAALEGNDVRFLISIAGLGVTGREWICETRYLMEIARGNPRQEVDEIVRLYRQLCTAVEANAPLESFHIPFREKAMRDFKRLSPEEQKKFGDVEPYFQSTYDGMMLRTIQSPLYKDFLTFNPLHALSKTKIPILLLYGEKDQLAPLQSNKDLMLQALDYGENKNYQAKIFPGADHYMTDPYSSQPSYVDGYLEYVADWINSTAK